MGRIKCFGEVYCKGSAPRGGFALIEAGCDEGGEG